MTAQHNEKSPAPAATGNEGNELGNGSVTTSYLPYGPDHTRTHLRTWGGDDLPKTDFIRVILPLETVQRMVAYGPQLVTLNSECAEKQSREVHLRREEQRAKKREERRRQLSNEIEEELFSEELAAIDAQADAIYSQIEKLVDERLAAGQQEKES